MILLYAFLTTGLFCLVAQVIMDNTKLTPGHITSMFTALGAFLSFIGVYPKLIKISGAGATILISNFGHLLYVSGIEGYHELGIIGIGNLLAKASLAIVSVTVFAFIFALLFKPKN